MADISLSKAVRSNLLSLKGTADMMAATQNRLATGNKVNSALDNPSSWFTAKGLTNRASDLGALLDSMANGVKTLEAADNGLTAMTKTLESMQSTLRQARQDKSFQTASYTINKDMDPASAGNISFKGGAVGDDAVDVSLKKTTVTGAGGFANGTLSAAANFTITSTDLNNGAAVSVALNVGDDVKAAVEKINEALNGAAGGNAGISASVKDGQIQLVSLSGDAVTLADGTSGADLALIGLGPAIAALPTPTTSGPITYDEANVGGGDLTINGKTITIGAGAAADATTIKNAIDGLGIEGLNVNASGSTGAYTLSFSLDSGKPLRIEGDNDLLQGLGFTSSAVPTQVVYNNGTQAIPATSGATTVTALKTVDELVGEINSTTGLVGNIRASNDNGKLRIENQSTQKLQVDGVSSSGAVDGTSAGAAEILGNTVRAGLAKQFNELRDQLDKLADDASFNGINLLRGDKLAITFNETGTSSIDIQTKDGATINSANLGVSTTLEESDLDSDSKIDAELTKLKNALNDVRSQASSFGSNLSIVENRQTFTKAMINTLEDGAGNLTLADMNTEAANLLALQTRQALSQNSLSLASQADQSILQLIR